MLAPRLPLIFPTSSTAHRTSSNWLFGWSAIVVGAALLVLEHDLAMGGTEFGVVLSVGSQCALISLAALGLALMLAPARRPLVLPGLSLRSIAAVGSLIAAALLLDIFSRDEPLSRLLSLGCLILVVAGMGRQFHARELSRLTLIITTAYLVLGMARELVAGSYAPQTVDYQFSGLFSADVQGIYSSLLVLATLPLLRHARSYLPLHVGLMATGLLSLLLTRSTVSCGAFLVAILVLLFMQPRPGKILRNHREWIAPTWLLAIALLYAFCIQAGEQRIPAFSVSATIGLLVVAAGFFQAWKRFQRTDAECYRVLAAQLLVAVIYAQFSGQWEWSVCAVLTAASILSMSLTPLIGPDDHQIVAKTFF